MTDTPRAKLSFRPPFAPHVEGVYDERRYDPEARAWEEQKIEITCEVCSTVHKVTCTTGLAREHVNRFARVHVHRDPLTDPFPGKLPGT